ncbi:MAG: 3-methyladenine DNA glycosylase [Chloroflexi bacterium]|nr:3-methyladenine DNA glycosylase [Chloroflexota bacterium]
MNDANIFIPTAPQFDFRQTVLSHGWRMLAPFNWDAEVETLQYVYQSADGDVQRLWMRAAENGVRVQLPDRPVITPELKSEVSAAVERMLNTGWDLSAFYTCMRAFDGYAWLERERQGRILISPSLWEDLAKVLLTTNCNWSQTVNMCRNLCQLGAPHPTVEGCQAFPSPQRIADMDFEEMAEAVRAGYRNAYLHELARQIAGGALDLDAWRNLDSDRLFKAVKALKGFGDYAAGTVARMVGHFDRIAIDTACHAMFAASHNSGVKADAIAIAAHYEGFGQWRGLVLWMDIMRYYSTVN